MRTKGNNTRHAHAIYDRKKEGNRTEEHHMFVGTTGGKGGDRLAFKGRK